MKALNICCSHQHFRYSYIFGVVSLRGWPTTVVFLAPEHLFLLDCLVKKMPSVSGKQVPWKLKPRKTKPQSHSLILTMSVILTWKIQHTFRIILSFSLWCTFWQHWINWYLSRRGSWLSFGGMIKCMWNLVPLLGFLANDEMMRF